MLPMMILLGLVWAVLALLNLLDPLPDRSHFFETMVWLSLLTSPTVGFFAFSLRGRRLVIDRAGVTFEGGKSSPSKRFPWNELSSLEIRRLPHTLPQSGGLVLVAKPHLGSTLLADKQLSKEWSRRGFLTICNIKWLRGYPQVMSALSAALVHYSGGRYLPETSTMT